ncbi:MAG: hypothetical protein ACLTON_05320 [Christensenellales bacterium]
MNNFYGILKIKNISKVKIDYYNKCKMSFDIICIDEKVTLKLICMENMIDRIYSKLKIDKTIFVYGVLLENNSVIARNIEIIR